MAGSPPKLHLLVEGQTEETVVRTVLAPYLRSCGWDVRQSTLKTKQTARGPAWRGGVSSWKKLERELRLFLGDSSLHTLSNVIDYYGFPGDAPGLGSRPAGDAYQRVRHVEDAIAKALGDSRFVPHLVLHELEAWVYAAADELGWIRDDPRLAARLLREATKAGGPELVDDGPDTAPSKRLLKHCRTYTKTGDGPQAISALGLAALRSRCPHLGGWLTTLDVRCAEAAGGVDTAR